MPYKDPEQARACKARYRERKREELREKGREYVRTRRQDPAFREAERLAAADWRAFEVDHVVPLSRGGLHIKANCKTTHIFCNRSKGNKLLSEMREVV